MRFQSDEPHGSQAHRGERWFIEVTGSTAACADGNHGHPALHDCDRPDCAMWRDGRETTNPEGWEHWYLKPFFFLKRVRSARWYELTGSVGPDLHQTFVIGRARTVTIEEDGEIYLFANDAAARYDKNYGSLRVRLVGLNEGVNGGEILERIMSSRLALAYCDPKHVHSQMLAVHEHGFVPAISRHMEA